MNHKLRIYCWMFTLVFLLHMFGNVFSFGYFHSASFVTYPDEAIRFEENPAEFYTTDTLGNTINSTNLWSIEVFVKPKPSPDKTSLLSTANGQTYNVNLQKVKLEIDASKSSINPIPIIIVVALVTIAVFFWLLTMVITVVRQIRSGEVFVSNVAKYLKKIGFLLAGIYLVQLIGSYIFVKYLQHKICLAKYYIVYENDVNIMYLLTGLALLIISQVILMGKDLKEEQDLTI